MAEISGALTLWYLLTAGSLVFLVWDLWRNTPTLWVMKLAWILIVLYTGPIGLFIYLLSCRQPLPGTHDRFIAPHWKQSVGSLMHCVAGDATGIILAAGVVFYLGLPNGIDLIIEYTSAFIVGLLIFQALFMKNMAGGRYLKAVRHSFFPETVSMNMVMVGMIPAMVILMHHLPGSDDPLRPLFWGVMSVATMVGMLTAYPINSWMVGRGIKHGMMSAPQPGSDVDTSGEAVSAAGDVTAEAANLAARGQSERGAPMQNEDAFASAGAMSHEEASAMAGMGMDHEVAPVTTAQKVGVLLFTVAVLAGAIWATSRVAPISLS